MQTILNGHKEVEILPETKLFAWLWSPFQDLSRRMGKEVLRQLTGAIGQINRAWRLPENDVLLDRIENAEVPMPERFASVAEVMHYLLRACPSEGVARVGEKTPLHIYHLRALLEFFPNAKVVIMQRDLRGAYHSQVSRSKKSKLSYRSFKGLLFVAAWRHGEVLARKFVRLYGGSTIYQMSYESLVTAPEQEIRKLCRFLNLSFEPSLLDVPVGNSSFEVESEGISSQSANRWQNGLNPELAAELAYLGQPYLDEAEMPMSSSFQLVFKRLFLRGSDAVVARFPELMCYLGRDSRYRKFSND